MEIIRKYYRQVRKYSLVALISLILGVTAYLYTLKSLNIMIEKSLIEIAKQGARTVQSNVQNNLNNLRTISELAKSFNDQLPIPTKLAIFEKLEINDQHMQFAIVTPDGSMITSSGETYPVADEKFFVEALNNEYAVELTEKKNFNYKANIVFAVPVYEGESLDYILCAFCSTDVYTSLAGGVRFYDKGYGYIIDFSGKVIAHVDNTITNAVLHTNDPKYKELSVLQSRMVLGETGSGVYTYGGQRKIMGFTRVEGVPWSFAVTTPLAEVYNTASPMLAFIGLFVCVFGLVLICINVYFVALNNKIKREEQSLKNAIETANLIIVSFLEDGFIIDFNANAERRLEYNRDNVVKILRIYDFLSPKDQEKLKQIIERGKNDTERESVELCVHTSKGECAHILFSINVINQGDDTPLYELMGIDITDRVKSEVKLIEKHEELTAVYEELAASEEELKDQLNELIRQKVLLQEKDERHNLVVEASNIGIWDWDMATNTHTYSDKWYEILGVNKEEFQGKEESWREAIVKEDYESEMAAYKAHLERLTPYYECNYRIRTPDGKIRWINAVGKALWDSDGKPVKMAGAITDITERKEIEEKVNKLAYFDTLTGLPNRSWLYENFKAIAEKSEKRIAFIFIDLNNFKLINDSYGHTIGDKLLVEVSKRLKDLCMENMHLSRLGGDEFAVMVWDYASDAALMDLVNDLVCGLEGMIRIGDYNISLAVNVGISVYPVDARDFDDLLKNADTAMFKATEKKCKYTFYSKEMNEALVERLNLRNNLQAALANNEFVLYYQPQYRTSDKKIMGFEALVRWKSETLGMIPPDKFIPIAEESGLILPLGEWILKEAFSVYKKLYKKGFRDMIMSVNISVIQLIQSNFAEVVIKLIDSMEIPPESIELEITESAMMESVDSVLHNIVLLREKGVRIALDDFGTGYSSLNYLTKIPINTLKIDKSFIDNIGQVREKSLLIGSIVDIGRRLGLSIVAEGVETYDQYDYLARRRCERIQGYLFSKPIPESEILNILYEAVE